MPFYGVYDFLDRIGANGGADMRGFLAKTVMKSAPEHEPEAWELFDLEADPGEFDNRWDDEAFAEERFRLMKLNFDALALALDTGPKQVTQF